MVKLDDKYPGYEWKSNKGYPTAAHRKALAEMGPCKEHRKSFQSIIITFVTYEKITTILFALLLTSSTMHADEGMWLLPLLNKLNGKAMTQAGLKLSPEDIYNINKPSLKDAIVIFGGGCTGEIVSGEGLLLTNHHCGYGAIQALSSVEHNYLQDGFWAKNKGEEIPSPGLQVVFMERMTDVTKEVLAVLDTCTTEESRSAEESF